MEMSPLPDRSKLDLFLERLLDGKCDSRLDLQRLLQHLSSEDATGVSIFAKWVVRAVATWSTSEAARASHVISFTLSLSGILSRNESRFNKLNRNNFFIKLSSLAKVGHPNVSSSVKLAYVGLFSSILEHDSGIEWMMACNFWEEILQLSLTSSDDCVVLESTNFVGKILERGDENFCEGLVKKMMLPLGENIYKCVKASGDVSDRVASAHLQPSLKLMANVLESSLKGVCFEGKPIRVILAFFKNFHLEQRVCDLMVIAHKECLVFDLSKIMFMMQFIDLFLKTLTNTTTLGKIEASINRIKGNFILNMYRGTFMDQIEFMKFGLLFWRMIELKIPSLQLDKPSGDRVYFSDLLVIFLAMTNMLLLLKYLVSLADLDEACANDDFRNKFLEKFRKNFYCEFMRVVYFWRDTIVDVLDTFTIAHRSLGVFKQLQPYLSRDQGVLLFQILIYFLKDFIRSSITHPEKLEFFLREAPRSSYLIQIFQTIGDLIQGFDIVLKDGIEATYVLDFCFDFLTLTEWTSDVVVQVVQLVNIAIAHYMAPSMALLVENAADSTMTLLGPFLYSKLLGENREVAKTALDVVCTAAHISNKNSDAGDSILELLRKWIKHAVRTWSETGASPRPFLVTFVTKLTTLFATDAEQFSDLKRGKFLNRLFAMLEESEDGIVKMAQSGLVSAFLDHNPGIEFIVASNLWEYVPDFDISSVEFVSKLVEKTIDVDESFSNEIVKRLMLRLEEETEKDSESLKSALIFLGRVLERFLEKLFFGESDYGPLLVFLKHFRLQERISDLMTISQSKHLQSDLGKIVFVMQFLELYVKIVTNAASTVEVKCSVARIKGSFLAAISKEDFGDALEFSNFGLLYWNLMESRILRAADCFSNQLFAIFLQPCYCMDLRYCLPLSDLEEQCSSDDIRDVYVEKIVKMIGGATHLHFIWRDRLIASPDLLTIASDCWSKLKNSRRLFSKNQAVIVFQTLIYSIKDLTRGVVADRRRLDIFEREQPFICQVLDFVAVLLEELDITWRDSVEAVEILSISFDFLALTEWSKRVVVQILELFKIALLKCLSPSLVLLLDSKDDFRVASLGNFLYRKLHEDEEVKDAALRVVFAMAYLSKSKFPSLQKVLMDSELPTLVVKMSTCDGESFVRATAIKCLQEMIQVEEIWNNALKTEDLSQKMRDVLLNETEGIVRVEAATFMCVAYEHQQFPKDALDRIYETMIYSSTTDLHWEVKVRALAFWDQVIKNHLQNQGMIDGTFPNVTFSKEHRKIVTLTDSEIRKRLFKVLKQLSAIGCLGVLTSAIKDDCDMEVSKTAVKIAQILVDLFKKYNVRSDSSAPTSPTPTENGHSGMSMSSGISVDESMDSPASGHHPDLNEEIIEQIVNSKDVTLLRNVYAPSDYGSVSNYDIQVRKIVTPNEFLQFTQQDLNGIISEKKKWLNGIEDLGSLLDDMLKTYDDDVNNMDCY